MHSHGIIHHDLKILNVLLYEEQHANITDFGFSKLRGQVTSIASSSHKASLGILAYKSPELMEADSDSDDEAGLVSWLLKKSLPLLNNNGISAFQHLAVLC